MITVQPNTVDPAPTQCYAREAFAKRVIYRPVLTLVSVEQNGLPLPEEPAPEFRALVTCADKLADAQAAYHRLITGGQVQYIHHDGETLTYTPALRSALFTYINQLLNECGPDSATGCTSGCACTSCTPSRGRAMGVAYV